MTISNTTELPLWKDAYVLGRGQNLGAGNPLSPRQCWKHTEQALLGT